MSNILSIMQSVLIQIIYFFNPSCQLFGKVSNNPSHPWFVPSLLPSSYIGFILTLFLMFWSVVCRMILKINCWLYLLVLMMVIAGSVWCNHWSWLVVGGTHSLISLYNISGVINTGNITTLAIENCLQKAIN